MSRAVVLLLLAACGAPAWQQVPHDRLFQRTPPPKLHPAPASNAPSDWWYALVHTTSRPLSELLSPSTYVGARDVLDVNAFGQVLDSPWFFNRISRYRLSPEEVARGPNRTDGLAPGPVRVIGGKLSGATPGLTVRDSAGVRFILKFDPPAYPGLSSHAEVIVTKLLHAAGYNVPENYVDRFELNRLVLDPGAETADRYGNPVPLTHERLKKLLTQVNPYPDGTVDIMLSRFIEGRILGPFDYRGTRADDPNDRIPHQDRRSLRGLGTFAAWLNNTDARSSNTLDVFVQSEEDPSLGYVKHYLIDFGDALGAAGVKPKHIGQGYVGRLDWAEVGKSFFSAGIYYPYWLVVDRAPYRSVGVFESIVFEPERWAPTVPNPAFDAADDLDVYWAASIIARFTPEQLAHVVRSVSYDEPGAAEWVLRVLTVRQYKILEYAFSRVLPLEDPRIERGGILALTDLAVLRNLAPQRRYRFVVTRDGDRIASGTVDEPRIDLSDVPPNHASPFLTVHLALADEDSPETAVHLRETESGLLPIGMQRTPR